MFLAGVWKIGTKEKREKKKKKEERITGLIEGLATGTTHTLFPGSFCQHHSLSGYNKKNVWKRWDVVVVVAGYIRWAENWAAASSRDTSFTSSSRWTRPNPSYEFFFFFSCSVLFPKFQSGTNCLWTQSSSSCVYTSEKHKMLDRLPKSFLFLVRLFSTV